MSKVKLILPPEIELHDDFKKMVRLCALFTEASNALAGLENTCNTEYAALIGEHKEDYALTQDVLISAEAAIETIAIKHPDWFPKERRSVKTPFGTVAFHKSTKLEVKNEELAVVLLQQQADAEATLAKAENREPQFSRETYLRQRTELNIEALEGLSDAQLKALRIDRVEKNNFSVKPAKVDMGKAVKEAVQQEGN
jgi:hypothetical protein